MALAKKRVRSRRSAVERGEGSQRASGFDALAGSSRTIRRLRDQIRQIAPMRTAVLVEGEPGSGKGAVALSLHRQGPRRGGPFQEFDCVATPESLQETELFGIAASRARGPGPGRPGLFEMASGGTLMLKGIEAASPRLQAQLLRAMQDRRVVPIGGADFVRVDVRVVAGTSRDLAAEVAAGRFRGDLFNVLAMVRIAVPPLRERAEDIPALAERLLRELARERGRRSRAITHGAMERLVAYPWPGNLRELRGVLEAMVSATRGRGGLEVSALPAELREREGPAAKVDVAVGMTLDEAERRLIEATMRHAGNRKPQAAAILGIGLRTLYRKLERMARR